MKINEREILSLPDLAELISQLSEKMRKRPTHALEYAGIPKQYLSKWKKDYGRAPYYYEIAKLAEYFDKPVEVFVYSDRDPQVHIPKEEFEQMIRALDSHIQSIRKETNDLRKSDFFNYQKYTA